MGGENLKKELITVLFLFLLVLISGSAFGYTIDDTTRVGKGQTASDNFKEWTDVIGTEFNIYGIDMSLTGSILDIDIYSDFNGSWSSGCLSLVAADLFLNLDGDDDNGISGYELAVVFNDHDGFEEGNIYSVNAAKTSYDVLEKTPGWYYGEYWHKGSDGIPVGDSPIVQIETGSDTGFNAELIDDPDLEGYFPDQLTSHEADYLWSLSIDLADFNFDYSNDVGIFLASATCANDIIEGSVHFDQVQEPATMLLFGTGMVGLAGIGRNKFIKK
jgi:hypothetical protein